MTEYTNLEIPPAPQALPPTPAKHKPNFATYAVIGCGGLLLLGALFAGGIFFFVTGLMKSNDPYKEAMRRAQHDARVVAKLGAPIKSGWFVGGSISTSGGSGQADLTVPLQGSHAEGSLHVVATKENGVWKYQRMQFRAQDGTEYDLVSPAIEREY